MRLAERYTLGRPLASLQDVQLELQAVGEALRGMLRFLGQFTADQAETMPAPQVGDVWSVYDAAAGTVRMYVQALAGVSRVRYSWPVDVEKA